MADRPAIDSKLIKTRLRGRGDRCRHGWPARPAQRAGSASPRRPSFDLRVGIALVREDASRRKGGAHQPAAGCLHRACLASADHGRGGQNAQDDRRDARDARRSRVDVGPQAGNEHPARARSGTRQAILKRDACTRATCAVAAIRRANSSWMPGRSSDPSHWAGGIRRARGRPIAASRLPRDRESFSRERSWAPGDAASPTAVPYPAATGSWAPARQRSRDRLTRSKKADRSEMRHRDPSAARASALRRDEPVVARALQPRAVHQRSLRLAAAPRAPRSPVPALPRCLSQ